MSPFIPSCIIHVIGKNKQIAHFTREKIIMFFSEMTLECSEKVNNQPKDVWGWCSAEIKQYNVQRLDLQSNAINRTNCDIVFNLHVI